MKTKTLILIPLLISSIISCTEKANLEEKIDLIFAEFENGPSPGVSVAVIESGEMVYEKAFGFEDLEKRLEIEPKTNFRLASITKQFTALSILILEKEGLLSLDDSLTKHFPEFPQYANNITIKNILQHTSGLLDYEDFVNENDTVQVTDENVLEILINQDSTYFKPGSEHRYSNSGYAVLSLLVKRLSGLTFPNFLSEKIFKPLKMNTTIAFVNGVNSIPNRSFGYAKTDSGFVYSDQSLTSAVLGDGGIYSSSLDLRKWDKEVDSATLIPKEKFSKSFEKGIDAKGESFDYGFGWRLDPYKNFRRIYHTGSTCGFSNIYMKLPEQNLTIIVLMNVRDYDAKNYAEQVADLFIN
jgi:CubicO group peptidase (beta-lactamase class C family)